MQNGIEQLFRLYHQTELLGTDRQSFLLEQHELIDFRKGEVLITRGEPADFYIVPVDGVLRSYVQSATGKEVTLRFVCPLEVGLDYTAFFLGETAKENLAALTDGQCWKVERKRFQRMLQALPSLQKWGNKWMIRSLLRERDHALSFHTSTALERYRRLEQEHPEVLHFVPLKHIASYLGIVDSTLSRLRKRILQEEMG